MSEVVEFYDKFSVRQSSIGINNRHLSIVYHLEQAGLKKSDRVLEVGCGVGTVSELILRVLSNQGSLHAVDISPQSIASADRLMQKYSNAIFEVKDLTQNLLGKKFDVIVLPDVIEHIPLELHPVFFKNLNEMLTDDGFIFIHIPHPNYLEWLVENKHTELQVIDQPIYTDNLLSVVYPIGFYIHYLKSYSIYNVDDDYQILILKKKGMLKAYTATSEYFKTPLLVKLKKKIEYVMRGLK